MNDSPPLGRMGKNVNIHSSVVFFNPARIFLGDNVRIDCFCLLSAGTDGIHIGNNVHLAAGVYVFGSGGKVVIDDFCGLSSRVCLYTASDDYSEGYLTGPTIPERYKKIRTGDVLLGRHVIIGCGSIVMPGLRLGIGASVGAVSFVNKDIADFLVVAGNPLRVLGRRNSQQLLELEKEYLCETKPR